MAGGAIPAEQWAAARALWEGEARTYTRVAAAMGQDEWTVRRRAHKQNWVRRPEPVGAAAADVLDGGGVPEADGLVPGVDAAGSPEERLERMAALLLGEVERIGAAARGSGRAPDKARIDAVWSMVRMLEKVEEFARERAGGIQAKRDEEMGDVLARIDGRIEELARAYAEELVRAAAREGDGAHMQELDGGEPERGAGAADPRRMAAERAA